MSLDRRTFLAGGLALAALGTLPGCGGQKNSGGGTSTAELVVMSTFSDSDYAGPGYKRAVESFTAATGIKVRSVFSSAVDIYTAYETSVLAGKEPDVLMCNLYDKALTFTQTGATVSATKYLTEWGLDQTILPEAVEQWTDSKGELQAFPFVGFTWPVWYNQQLLEKAGVSTIPTTSDELIAAAEKIRGAGLQPFAVGGSDWSGQKLFLQIIQSRMPREEAEKLMAEGGYAASPTAKAGVEEFVKLRDGGVFPNDVQGLTSDNMVASFNTGKAAIMSTGSWSFDGTPKAVAQQVKFGGFPLPQDAAFTKPMAYRGFTANGIWLNKASEKRIDDVKAFATHMFSAPVLTDFVKLGVVPTAKVDDLPSVLSAKPLLLSALTELPDTVEFAAFPDFSIPGAKTQSLIKVTGSAFAPGTSVDAILSGLDSVYN